MSNAPDGLPEVERNSAQLFDFEQLKDYAGFVGNALRRHPLLALLVFVSTATLALGAAKYLPRTYYTQTSILAKRNFMLAALVNPERTNKLDPEPPSPMRPNDVDERTRAAAEEVLQRENLVSIIKKVNLMDRWESTRPPLLRVKDSVMRMLRGPVSEEDRLDGLVGMLEKNISVDTDGGKVTIGVVWNDPQVAYDIASAAQKSFFIMREREELAHITEAITILEQHGQKAEENLRRSLEEFEKLFSKINRERRRVVGDPRVMPMEAEQDQRMAQLRYMIRSKRRDVQDAAEQLNKRLVEERAKLAELQSMYAASHPAVVEQRQKVEVLAETAPGLDTLQSEEQQLLGEYSKRGGRVVPYPDEPNPDPFGLERVLAGIMPSIAEHPKAAVALEQLRNDLVKNQALGRRLNDARMERDVAEAVFKHRYTVITPVEFPDRPAKPNALVIAVGGVVAGLVLGVFASLAKDVLGGRVLESWQVKRSLGLPVLAEFDPP